VVIMETFPASQRVRHAQSVGIVCQSAPPGPLPLTSHRRKKLAPKAHQLNRAEGASSKPRRSRIDPFPVRSRIPTVVHRLLPFDDVSRLACRMDVSSRMRFLRPPAETAVRRCPPKEDARIPFGNASRDAVFEMQTQILRHRDLQLMKHPDLLHVF